MEDRLEKNYEETDDNQHIDWRERHLAMAADIVAHQIARPPQQLEERIGQRAGVQSQDDGEVLADGLPPHTSHLGTLPTDWTEVADKLIAAVVTLLHLSLIPVGIVRHSLLPVTETEVVFLELLFGHDGGYSLQSSSQLT